MELLRYRVYSETEKISGQRPVMVFVHCLGGNNATWIYQIQKLKKYCDLVMIELPSHGKNSIQLSQMVPSFDAITDKVMEVLDHLHIEKATFLGCSLGTMVVKHILLTRPNRVDKYILIGPIGYFPSWLRAIIKVIAFLLPCIPRDAALKLLSRIVMPNKMVQQGRDLYLRCAKGVEKKEFIVWLKLLTCFNTIQDLYWKTMEDEPDGLYIIGEMDHLFLPMLEHEMNNARHVVVLENAGHICNVDQPKSVNQLILDFQGIPA